MPRTPALPRADVYTRAIPRGGEIRWVRRIFRKQSSAIHARGTAAWTATRFVSAAGGSSVKFCVGASFPKPSACKFYCAFIQIQRLTNNFRQNYDHLTDRRIEISTSVKTVNRFCSFSLLPQNSEATVSPRFAIQAPRPGAKYAD